MNSRLLSIIVSLQLAASDAQAKVSRSVRTRRGSFLLLAGVAAGLLAPEAAMAAGAAGFGAIGTNVGTNANGMADGLHKIFLFLGFAMAGMGAIMAFTAHNKHEPATKGILTFVAGVVLASLVAIIGTGSSSLFGSDQASSGLGTIGITQ